MARRLGGLLTFVCVVLSLVAHQLGWVDGVLLLRIGATLGLVLGLVGVVRLPWDLTFQARNAVARQEAARRRGLLVDETELAFTKKSASRSLLLAIALHLVGAALAIGLRSVLGAELGTLLALAFLGSMAARPIHAFYLHTQHRLMAAERDAEMPPADARSLAARLLELEEAQAARRRQDETRREALDGRLSVMETRTQDEARAWRRAATATDEKLDQILRELLRTVERTQENAEVLAGIRAFVRLIRES
jgi:hypothetical protein